MLVYAYNCTQNSTTGFSPYYHMFGRQLCLPVDVALGLVPCTITEPNTSKFVQKLRECARWAQKKAEAFRAKEAQRNKCNYDKRGRAAALEVRETVLVHVTAFKGHHKIQNRWENRGICCGKTGPIPICQFMWYAPGTEKGAARPYIGTICSPSTLTYSRARRMKPMGGVGNDTSLTPAPSVDNVPSEARLSGMVMSSSADNTPQGCPD